MSMPLSIKVRYEKEGKSNKIISHPPLMPCVSWYQFVVRTSR